MMKSPAALLLSALVASLVTAGAAVAAENKPAFKPDPVQGQALAATCLGCHTADGSRGLPANPLLQGQHPEYIVKQLTEFKNLKQSFQSLRIQTNPETF